MTNEPPKPPNEAELEASKQYIKDIISAKRAAGDPHSFVAEITGKEHGPSQHAPNGRHQ